MASKKAASVKAATPAPMAEWTVMVYLAGDNNLNGAGVTDLREMKSVGSTPQVNVVAQFDRAGPGMTSKRYYLRSGTSLAKDEIKDLGETNTGDPAVLLDFFNWAVKAWPAKRYALVLWNHGSGVDDSNLYADHGDYFSGDAPPVVRKGLVMNAAGGVAKDQARAKARKARPVPMAQARAAVRHGRRALFGTSVSAMVTSRAIAFDDQAKDFLDNMELKSALGQMKKTLGRPLDIIGFDACLMSMLEVDYQLKDCATCAIGSEEEEPGNGWPYDTILKALTGKPKMTAAELAIKAVGLYAASYRSGDRVTLAATDLTKAGAVASAVDHLGRQLVTALADGDAMALTTLRAKVQEYTPPYDEYVDLVDLCDGLQKLLADATIHQACAEVKAAVSAMVLASAFKGAGVARSNGVSIYFPKRKVSPLYAKLDFSKGSAWAAFIAAYVAEVAKPL